jgi:Flp pilus assembly protein TadG
MSGGCRIRPAAGSAPDKETSYSERGRVFARRSQRFPGSRCVRGPGGPGGGNPRRRGAVPPGDSGSISLWVVIFTFTTLALLILVVDGGQAMNAKSRAADIAEQAARAAADDVNVATLRAKTGTVNLAPGACDLKSGPAARLVANYASGVPGATATLTVCTPSTTTVGGTASLAVTATVQLSVRPTIPVPPFTTISATAQETAYLACGSNTQREAC